MKDKNKVKILARSIYLASQNKTHRDLETVAANFSGYLKKHHLEKLIPEILTELENIYLAEQGIVAAQVSSTQKLSDTTLKHIETLLHSRSGKKVQIKSVLDQELLGGVSIRYNDKIIDLSLKNQLHNLTKQLNN
ncbi:MAG: ATP synthase F1 subunit delta [Parcubacteria group bacterium]|nr:MAG: ATP synthase F1 subunit delta [Parcubacteria group bacterium]